FHDKAPTVVPDGEGGEAWQFAPDAPPAPIGIYASAGRKHEDVRWTGVTFAEANQGNFRACAASQNLSSSGRMVGPTLGMVLSQTPRMPRRRQRSISRIDSSTPRAGMQARPIRRSGAAFTNSSAIQLL